MSRVPPRIEEVHDALYVDYEAWQDGPPVILGILRVQGGVESFRQEVLHEDLQPAGTAKGLIYSTPEDAMERLATEVAGAVSDLRLSSAAPRPASSTASHAASSR